MKQAVVGMVPTPTQADTLIVSLRARGISSSDISVIMPDFVANGASKQKQNKAPAAATAGAGTGLILGGALGWLAGIGAISIPGLGPLVGAGPIMAALSGAAVAGGVGGFIGALIGFGIPEYEARQYEGKLRDGNILVSVHAVDTETAKSVEQILRAEGAQNVNSMPHDSVGYY